MSDLNDRITAFDDPLVPVSAEYDLDVHAFRAVMHYRFRPQARVGVRVALGAGR